MAPPHPDDQERLRDLVRRIARNDRPAFRELHDACAGPLASRLSRQMPDSHRCAGIIAGTFVEVWWLAGCYTEPNTDVMQWMATIVARRLADGALHPTVPGMHLAPYVELELAALLAAGQFIQPPRAPHLCS